MINYINNIKINSLFHLENFNIPIEDSNFPHLFITGKNGSGKTVLLNAIADFLERVRNDEFLSFLHFKPSYENFNRNSGSNKIGTDQFLKINEQNYIKMYGKVDVNHTNIEEFAREMHKDNFIVAFYAANRRVEMSEPRSPEKPAISNKKGVRQISTKEFLKFLVDLKIQAALAQNEKLTEDAKKINEWFDEFQKLLGTIYNDLNLELKFNYKDYSFHIHTQGKKFRFNQLSDGYAAIIDIVADLILRMQNEGSATRAYEQRGIVLIDEIETHLHLELQKNIMPILTKVFPNIQFIVTTHSPFVLSSLPNAVAFDLESKEPITELNEYSYEALAEGYFGVSTPSSYMEMRLNELKTLLEKSLWTTSEKVIVKQLIEDFENVSEIASPDIKGEFNKLMIIHLAKVQEVKND